MWRLCWLAWLSHGPLLTSSLPSTPSLLWRSTLFSLAQHAELQKSQQTAATLLQGLYRGFKDRKTVKQVRMQHALDKMKLQDLFGWGASMIQKTYRAYVRAAPGLSVSFPRKGFPPALGVFSLACELQVVPLPLS